MLCGTANAWFLDFEWGLGYEGDEVAMSIPGLHFTSTGSHDWLYADITANHYNATSDNGTAKRGVNRR